MTAIRRILGQAPIRSYRTWPLLLACIGIIAVCFAMEAVFHLYRHYPYDESGLVTRLSVLQLSTICIFMARTYSLRLRSFPKRSRKDPWVFWLLCSLAFAYLAMDEKMLLHEGIGHIIRDNIWTGEGSFSSRADDYIVGIYGIFAAILAWKYRWEILRAPRAILFGLGGFAGLAGTVVLDTLSHRDDFVGLLIHNPDLLEWVLEAMARAEEACKLLGEAFFLAAAHAVLRRVMEDFPVDDLYLNRNTRRWQWTLFAILMILAVAFSLEHPEVFARVWFLHLVPLAAFALLAARAMGFTPSEQGPAERTPAGES